MAAILGEEHARGLTLVADYQERGSGRKGRSWIAAPGTALLCTIGLPDPMPTGDLWIVPFWTALAVRAALMEFNVPATLQWPNDVLADGNKISGILCISRVIGETAWAGSGIGVNVRRPNDDPELAGIQPPPAFVSDYAGGDRDTFLDSLLRHVDESYEDLSSPLKTVRAWEAAGHLPGVRYRIAVDGEAHAFDATALRVLAGGALLVESDGVRREINLADARILR